MMMLLDSGEGVVDAGEDLVVSATHINNMKETTKLLTLAQKKLQKYQNLHLCNNRFVVGLAEASVVEGGVEVAEEEELGEMKLLLQ